MNFFRPRGGEGLHLNGSGVYNPIRYDAAEILIFPN